MPKTRHAIAALTLAAAGALFTASPASAEMTSRDCDWGVSGWSSAKVCVTVTYFQPTASKYEITKVRVEASDIGDTKRVEFSLLLWDDEQVTWKREGVTLNPDNGWDKVYTPEGLRTDLNAGMTCLGSAYFDVGGSGFFAAEARV